MKQPASTHKSKRTALVLLTLFFGSIGFHKITYADDCLQSFNVKADGEFNLVDLSGEHFPDLFVNMSCPSAENIRNSLVFRNEYFLSIEDFANYKSYSEKIRSLSANLESGYEALQIANTTDLRKAVIDDALLGFSGAVTAIGCVSSWGALCMLGLTATAGSYANSSFNSGDDTLFELSLTHLANVGDQRRQLMKESDFSSRKQRYVNFVSLVCTEVKKQCEDSSQ